MSGICSLCNSTLTSDAQDCPQCKGWACAVCTFRNPTTTKACSMCGSTRPAIPQEGSDEEMDICGGLFDTAEPVVKFQKNPPTCTPPVARDITANYITPGAWSCVACTFENSGGRNKTCQMCGHSVENHVDPTSSRLDGDDAMPAAAVVVCSSCGCGMLPTAQADVVAGVLCCTNCKCWACPSCTFQNPVGRTLCEICSTSKKKRSNVQSKNPASLLHAIETGDTETLAALLAAGEDPNKADSKTTPLAMAAESRQAECLSLLLKAGGDPNREAGDFKWTPCHAAAARGSSECLALLIANGGNPYKTESHGSSVVHIAARAGEVACLQLVLSQPKPIPAAEVNRVDTQSSATPLHQAVNSGMRECVVVLLKAGADISIKDNNGQTPLHRAASLGYIEVLQALLTGLSGGSSSNILPASKAALSIVDKNNLLPIHLVAGSKSSKAVWEVALASTDKIEATTTDNRTALHIAAETGDPTVVQMLLSLHADPNAQTSKYWTPLHYACDKMHPESVKLLLEAGADPNGLVKEDLAPASVSAGEDGSEDEDLGAGLFDDTPAFHMKFQCGATPCLIAAQRCDIACLTLLVNWNANVNLGKLSDGQRICHVAARTMKGHNGGEQILRLLLSAGADPNALYTTKDVLRPADDYPEEDEKGLFDDDDDDDTVTSDGDFGAAGKGTAAAPKSQAVTPVDVAVAEDLQTAFELLLDYGGDLRLSAVGKSDVGGREAFKVPPWFPKWRSAAGILFTVEGFALGLQRGCIATEVLPLGILDTVAEYVVLIRNRDLLPMPSEDEIEKINEHSRNKRKVA